MEVMAKAWPKGVLFTAVLAISGCGWQGPSLAGHPGLQYQVTSFYADHAMERNSACPNPRMQAVTGYDVIEDTPERVVMNIKYYWIDDSQSVDVRGGGSVTTCQDRSERTFTFTKTSNGDLQVTKMTGLQRRT